MICIIGPTSTSYKSRMAFNNSGDEVTSLTPVATKQRRHDLYKSFIATVVLDFLFLPKTKKNAPDNDECSISRNLQHNTNHLFTLVHKCSLKSIYDEKVLQISLVMLDLSNKGPFYVFILKKTTKYFSSVCCRKWLLSVKRMNVCRRLLSVFRVEMHFSYCVCYVLSVVCYASIV